MTFAINRGIRETSDFSSLTPPFALLITSMVSPPGCHLMLVMLYEIVYISSARASRALMISGTLPLVVLGGARPLRLMSPLTGLAGTGRVIMGLP